ncbi:hypothetical protein [Sporanaerobacter sp. PP17-6a]|uniref:hypothetical protein n=1 Tax=Sporanaerobacter sp. PP17-6a TaxID=1891289 RepID=UPI0008A02EDC|nr:hypothetical protein [Sporanaerobacter sp. PP17-6a]SCL88928.1 hypothetical protein PP176A_1634 [Sporanaerobacter sp. PP17-6a]
MKKGFIVLILMIIIVSSTSCQVRQNQKPTTYKKSDKASEGLYRIVENINDIIIDVEKAGKLSATFNESTSLIEADILKEKEKKKEEIKKAWEEINSKIKDSHESWNKYEKEIMERGATSEYILKFKNSLNGLTVAVENRENKDIINYGSKALFDFSPFLELYKDEFRGETSRIKYYVYQSYLAGENNELEKAKDLLDMTEEYTAGLRQKIEDDQKKMKIFEKLVLSLQDMKEAINVGNNNLLKIKRDIILQNIKDIEE